MIGTTALATKRKSKTRKPGRPKKNLAPAAGMSADIKQTMLNLTIGLIADRGYDGFALRDVAEAVGVHTALVGYYFKSKLQLEQAAFDHYVERMQIVLAELKSKVESLNDSPSQSPSESNEGFKEIFWELVRVLSPGETNFRFYRWTITRGGKFSKELHDRLCGPILRQLSEKMRRSHPGLTASECEARVLLFFTLAEACATMNSTYAKVLKSTTSERELQERYTALAELALPEIFGAARA